MRIAHLSDIHIRDTRRDEYSDVFDALEADITANPVDAIAIAGDTFHMMTRASANNWTDVAELFKRLSNLAPLFVIPGNHDLNVRAKDSPDLISPMLEAAGGAQELQPPRVTYWRHSGIYSGAGAVWAVGAPDGDFPDPGAIREALMASPGSPLVALFHETVDGARYSNGVAAPDGGRLSRAYLADVAACAAYVQVPCAILLGDVHLRQEIQFQGSGAKAAAWYPGSLVCQTFGESHTDHGWARWTLRAGPTFDDTSVAVDLRDIPNPTAHLTIDLRDGVDVTPEPRPERPRAVRLRYDAATPSDVVAHAVKDAEEKYRMPLRSVEEVTGAANVNEGAAPAGPDASLAAATTAAGDWTRHEKYIRDALAGEPAERVEAVVARHHEEVARDLGQAARGARAEIVRLEFDNLYCYGKGNVIDFELLREGPPGLRGLVAPNRSGKSSIFDVLTFALCDDVPRGAKKDLVRRGAKAFSLRLTFRIDGVEGRIEKTGTAWKNAHPTVRLWLGEEELTEATATQTTAVLRTLVGDPAHLETIAMARPTDVTGRKPFALQTSAARRESLASLLRLGSFADVEKKVAREVSGLRAELRGLAGAIPDLTAEKVDEYALAAETGKEDEHVANEEVKRLKREWMAATEKAAVTRAAFTAAGVEAEDAGAFTVAPGPTVDAAEVARLKDEMKKAKSMLDGVVVTSTDDRAEKQRKFGLLDQTWRDLGEPAPRAVTDEEKVFGETLAVNRARLAEIERQAVDSPALTPELRALALEARPPEPDLAGLRDLAREAPSQAELERLRALAELEGDAAPNDAEALPEAAAAKARASEAAQAAQAEADRLGKALAGLGTPPPAGQAFDPFADIGEFTQTLRDYQKHRQAANSHADLLTKVEKDLRPAECGGCRATAAALGAADQAHAVHLWQRLHASGSALLARLKDDHAAKLAAAQAAGVACARAEYAVGRAAADALNAAEAQVLKSRRWAEARRALDESDRKSEADRLRSELAEAEETAKTIKGVRVANARAQLHAELEKTAGVTELRARLTDATHAYRQAVALNAIAKYRQAKAVAEPAEKALQAATLALEKAEGAARNAQSEAHASEQRAAEAARVFNIQRPLEENLAIALAYRRILAPKTGLAGMLLDEARGGVEERINRTLSSMESSFRVAITPDYEMYLVDNATKVEVPPALGSGYQQFALDLAVRAALGQISQVPIPACMLIDEGFGCLDEANLMRVADALATIAAADPRILILAVTHREDLSAQFAKQLTIETGLGPSRIVFPAGAEQEELPIAAAAGDEQAAADGVAMYTCEACGVNIKATWRAKHEKSAKHAAGVARAAQAAEVAEQDPDAEVRPGGRLACLKCNFAGGGTTFTPGTWARHAKSKIHLQ